MIVRDAAAADAADAVVRRDADRRETGRVCSSARNDGRGSKAYMAISLFSLFTAQFDSLQASRCYY